MKEEDNLNDLVNAAKNINSNFEISEKLENKEEKEGNNFFFLVIHNYLKDEENEVEEEEDISNLSIEEKLFKEKEKSKKIKETMKILLEQITEYKMVMEEEKILLQNQLKEEKLKKEEIEKQVIF